jgi:hypothetical protein
VDGERTIALSFGIFALMLFGAMIGGILELRDPHPQTAASTTQKPS